MHFSFSIAILLSVLAIIHATCPTPTITQTFQSTWTNGGNEETPPLSLYDVVIFNSGDEPILKVYITISANLSQFWEIIEDEHGGYTLPSWRDSNGGIPAGQSHTFGFISIGSEPVNVSVIYFYCTKPKPAAELFHVSTLQALSAGLLDGVYPVGQLKLKGDFGLGTYEGFNGEMIFLDGVVYHAYADGRVEVAKDDELCPFAAVVPFSSESLFNITSPMTQPELNTFIASIIPSDNYFYAIKIHGHYEQVTTRAIPLLSRPYPTLSEAEVLEVFFNKRDFNGTSVVLRGPQYTSNLNAAGDHFHFISDDKDFGGHSMNLTITEGTLEIQQIRKFKVWLPDTVDFRAIELDS